jgi:1-acylglycerone phosphate reductase
MATDDKRKSVLITGCAAGGIGHSLALCFHKRGFRVFATARSLTQLTALADQGIETLELVVDNDESILSTHQTIERLTKGRGLDFLGNLS